MVRPTKCTVMNCIVLRQPLHKYPDPYKERERFNKWVEMTGNKQLLSEDVDSIYRKGKVCEKHFSYKQKSYWDPEGRLRRNAIPDAFLGVNNTAVTSRSGEMPSSMSKGNNIKYSQIKEESYSSINEIEDSIRKVEEIDSDSYRIKEEKYPANYEIELTKFEEDPADYEEQLTQEENSLKYNIELTKFEDDYMNVSLAEVSSSENYKEEGFAKGDLTLIKSSQDIHIENFNCSLCKFTTTNFELLKLHSLIHSEAQLLICYHCDYSTKSIKKLRHHIKQHFDFIIDTKQSNRTNNLNCKQKFKVSRKLYKCQLCKHVAYTSNDMKRHLLTHKGGHFYKCNICEYWVTRKDTFQSHMKIVHSGATIKHCQPVKFKPTQLRKNIIKTDDRPNRCSICPYVANNALTLKDHLLTHMGLKSYKCKYCDFTAVKTSTLRIHSLNIHNGEKPNACTFCSYRVKRYRNLLTHMLTHAENKTLSCTICGNKSDTIDTLKKHMKTHIHKRMYKCELCDYKAENRGRIKSHHTTVHAQKDRGISCPFCGFKTVMSNLKTHLEFHFGGKLTVPSKKSIPVNKVFRNWKNPKSTNQVNVANLPYMFIK